MNTERARTINTLREITLSLHDEQQPQAQELLETLEPVEATDGRPSAAQLSVVALESLDAWYVTNGLRNGTVLVQREVPRSLRDVTTAVDALARKGRALRSAGSLLQRHPERTVAGAGAYLVATVLDTLASQQDASFEQTLDELLPKQAVSEPVTNDSSPSAEPAAANDMIEVVDETVDVQDASADGPEARYTAIVETRFMAGVKEFFQWMGESHAVTGTGLPKRADIQDVAATIDIQAEGVAKKPASEESVASDHDLTIPAEPRATRYVTSAQAIPELMAFWRTLQETGLVEVNSTSIQPGKDAPTFGFEEYEQLQAAEELVAAYVCQTLTLDADEQAAAATAAFLTDGTESEAVLVPRVRQLELVGLIELDGGQPTIPAPLRPAVEAGLAKVTA